MHDGKALIWAFQDLTQKKACGRRFRRRLSPVAGLSTSDRRVHYHGITSATVEREALPSAPLESTHVVYERPEGP